MDQDIGDTVQVDVMVESVGDGAFDSSAIVDFIYTECEVLPSLTYDPVLGGLKLTWKVLSQTGTEQNGLSKPITIIVY